MSQQDSVGVRGHLAQISAQHRTIKRELDEVRLQYAAFVKACEAAPKSPTEQIDSIPGRRIFYHLVGDQSFDATFGGTRAAPISMLVSQDGPFIMTHYPMVIWKPTAPADATNFGKWRPVTSWPLPDQVIDTDTVDLSWELVSGGSQRNFQNQAIGPIFSRPDNMVPLPIPTLFAPNETIQVFLTYEDITFDGSTPPTSGLVRVSLPGYRVVNM